MEQGTQSAAEIEIEGFAVDEGVRRTMEVEVDDATVRFADAEMCRARAAAEQHFGITLTGAEGAGFFRYTAGGFYRPHRDSLDEAGDAFVRRITVVIFLGTAGGDPAVADCVGGALRLHGDDDGAQPVDITPEQGTLVAFPSDVLHEVLPVEGGVRDVVVDRFY